MKIILVIAFLGFALLMWWAPEVYCWNEMFRRLRERKGQKESRGHGRPRGEVVMDRSRIDE